MKYQLQRNSVLFSLFLFLSVLIGCTDENKSINSEPSAKTQITILTSVGDFADMVKEFVQPAMEKKGYTIKLIETDDSLLSNIAVGDGSADINIFQHKPYLDSFKKDHPLPLVEVFEVPTAPFGIYGGKTKSLKDVTKGSTIIVPNNPSNYARVLVILDYLGWITLKEHIDPLLVSSKDIVKNNVGINIQEMPAAQIPRSLKDADFGAINGNYALSSGLKLTDALLQEPSFTMINYAVVRESDIGEQWLQDLEEIYNSAEFKAYINIGYAGYQLPPSWNDQEI